MGNNQPEREYEEKRLKQKIQKFIKIDIIALYQILFHEEAYFYSLLQNDTESETIKKSGTIQEKICSSNAYPMTTQSQSLTYI